MSIHEAAREYKANMDATRLGAITPDEFRTRNRALREKVGDVIHMQAKLRAIAASNR